MNDEEQERLALSAAAKSPWLKAITEFTAIALILDGLAFWVVLALALFGVVPWVALLWVIGIASGILVFSLVASALLGLWHGLK